MNIHIVDDDMIVHALAELVLKTVSMEFKMSSFYNGQDGIRNLAYNKANSEDLPDMIILDINMPIMDGITYLEHYDAMVSEMAKKPAVFIVSSCLISTEELSSNRNVGGVFSKPVSKEKIEMMLGKMNSMIAV